MILQFRHIFLTLAMTFMFCPLLTKRGSPRLINL